jgi:two-component system sporulation sensor kinase B
VNKVKVNNQGDLNLEKQESIPHLSSALIHEIRNPMTAVKGFLQLITSGDFNEEKKREYALIAISEIDRAENIIRDFLTYFRPNYKSIKKIDVKEELNKVLTILQPLAILNEINMFFCCNTNYFIHGENSLVQQCLINLCKNAIEAMEKGGSLSISTWNDHEQIYIEIKDTGVGMSEEQLSQLGEPFFTTKGEKGTGLGLMLTYRIVKNMNGTIKVKSELGMGTAFILTFPCFKELANEFIS